MSSIHDQQTEDLRFRVLKLLQERPDISQRDLARQLGISHGKMNYCLKALMDKGLVKLENFQNSQHKFNYAYLLTPAGISEKAAVPKHLEILPELPKTAVGKLNKIALRRQFVL